MGLRVATYWMISPGPTLGLLYMQCVWMRSDVVSMNSAVCRRSLCLLQCSYVRHHVMIYDMV